MGGGSGRGLAMWNGGVMEKRDKLEDEAQAQDIHVAQSCEG